MVLLSTGRYCVYCFDELILQDSEGYFMREQKNIYLVGYMGSGKSTAGKQLARTLGYGHIDLDNYFEETYRISIMDFFKKYDEQAFRVIERKLLQQTFDLQRYVVSTGGGTACFSDNIDLINRHGISVYIRMSEKSLFHRLKHSRRPRPRAFLLDDEALQKRIGDDMQQRAQFYNKAAFHIKGEDFEVGRLVEMLRPVIAVSL